MSVKIIDPSGEAVDYVTLDFDDIPDWLSVFALDQGGSLAGGDRKTVFNGEYAAIVCKSTNLDGAFRVNFYIRQDACLAHTERRELARLLTKYGVIGEIHEALDGIAAITADRACPPDVANDIYEYTRAIEKALGCDAPR